MKEKDQVLGNSVIAPSVIWLHFDENSKEAIEIHPVILYSSLLNYMSKVKNSSMEKLN